MASRLLSSCGFTVCLHTHRKPRRVSLATVKMPLRQDSATDARWLCQVKWVRALLKRKIPGLPLLDGHTLPLSSRQKLCPGGVDHGSLSGGVDQIGTDSESERERQGIAEPASLISSLRSAESKNRRICRSCSRVR
jgi:hypothetical protein